MKKYELKDIEKLPINILQVPRIYRCCFLQDNDSHWYSIPVDKKEDFYKWVESMENCEDCDDDFEDCRLNMHISNYSFENLEEIYD